VVQPRRLIHIELLKKIVVCILLAVSELEFFNDTRVGDRKAFCRGAKEYTWLKDVVVRQTFWASMTLERRGEGKRRCQDAPAAFIAWIKSPRRTFSVIEER
jgi:hypothetical protein